MFLGEENKALVRLFNEEFWNKGNLAAADELIEASAAIFLPGRGQVSLDDCKAFAASLRSAFPNWYAPTGRQVTIPGAVFYRLASGKITQFRGLFDGLALMQQLGAIPDHE